MVMKKKQVGAMKRGGEIMKARGGKMIEAMMQRGGKVMKGKKKKITNNQNVRRQLSIKVCLNTYV